MKKSLSLIILLAVCIGISYIFYSYYATPRLRQPYYSIMQEEDTFRIAYIGDSWAFFHKNHECQIAQILEDTLHRPVRVHSYGICGQTSKEIYEQLFDNSDFRHFLHKRRYEACFVSAGINDSYKKMGTNYYKQSMDGIIQFLLANHIFPIILEIPDYDIEKAYNRQPPQKKLLRQLSMLVNDCDLNCKQEFRNVLDKIIQDKGYQDSISVIRYKSWNGQYQQDLQNLYWPEGMHLNEHGYEMLDSMIIQAISEHSTFWHNQ